VEFQNLLKTFPGSYGRVRGVWAKAHYQRHIGKRNCRFIKEQIRILSDLMSTDERSRLILVGDPASTSGLREQLPHKLLAKLVDVDNVQGKGMDAKIVQEILPRIIEEEESKCQSVEHDLACQLRSGGLAVAGAEASYQALKRNQGDTLVMASDLGLGWDRSVMYFNRSYTTV